MEDWGMSESAFWQRLNKVLHGAGMLLRVENSVCPGTPDVFYTLNTRDKSAAGHIELKVCELGERLNIRHFTQSQKIMLRRWCKSGGLAWFFLRAGKGSKAEYFLVDGITASTIPDSVDKKDLSDMSVLHSNGFPKRGKLLSKLTGD